MAESVGSWLGAIDSIVGIKPTTCPWRALYHPLAIEVMDVCTLAEKSVGLARLGFESPAILLDAITVFERSRAATLAHHLEQKRNSKA